MKKLFILLLPVSTLFFLGGFETQMPAGSRGEMPCVVIDSGTLRIDGLLVSSDWSDSALFAHLGRPDVARMDSDLIRGVDTFMLHYPAFRWNEKRLQVKHWPGGKALESVFYSFDIPENGPVCMTINGKKIAAEMSPESLAGMFDPSDCGLIREEKVAVDYIEDVPGQHVITVLFVYNETGTRISAMHVSLLL